MPKIIKHRRRKALTIMFFPILVLVGVIGWFMYSLGSRKQKSNIKPRPSQNDYITFLPRVIELSQEIEN